MSDTSLSPLQLQFKPSVASRSALDAATQSQSGVSLLSQNGVYVLRNFTSYSFERSLMTPAAAFRFTAPGVEKALRQSIRSGDFVQILATTPGTNDRVVLASGFVDETDTHVTPSSVEYVVSGRDTIGQLVDNAVVDAQSKIINFKSLNIQSIVTTVIANTRMPQEVIVSQIPNVKLIFNTNAGETKINALQRNLELVNCLLWSSPDGRVIVGKPNFSQAASGALVMRSDDPSKNNLLEARVRRNVNTAIRQIVTQLQTLEQVDAGAFTIKNSDPDVTALASAHVGRSVYQTFSYGQGTDAYNNIVAIGAGDGSPKSMGAVQSLREIARENMKVLEVECVVRGHFNERGIAYAVDQVYDVSIDSDSVAEPMYVYSVSYELTVNQGMLTRMHLCKLGTITTHADARTRKS